jgi:hypothetical protein
MGDDDRSTLPLVNYDHSHWMRCALARNKKAALNDST